MIICRTMEVKLFKDCLQLGIDAAGGGQRCGVDQVIAAARNGFPMRLHPVHVHKPHIAGIVTLYLVDGKAVTPMSEEGFLPLLLMLLALQDFFVEHRALLPFLTGNSEHRAGGLGIQFLPVKQHLCIAAVHDGVHAQILIVQFRCPFSGQGQHIPIQIAAGFQISCFQGFIRHGVFVQHLLWGVL